MEPFITKKFEVEGTTAMLVKIRGQAEKDANRSMFNLANVRGIMEILEGVLRLKTIPAKCMTILAFCNAQVDRLHACLANFHQRHPQMKAEKVDVRTVDSFQDGENHVLFSTRSRYI